MVDSKSQLWAQISGNKLNRFECLMRNFTAKIYRLKHLTYWESLKSLDISCIKWRFEPYRTNYSYNLLRSLMSNCGLSWCYQDKCNTMMSTASMAKYSKSQRAQSFQYIGPHYFNCFPSYLRDSIMEFFTNKELYDEFLSNSQYLHEPRNWAGWEIRVGSCKIPHHVETLLFFFLFVLLLV